jgi:hypothetical protein
MNERGKWQGMLTIARLNWPFFTAALAILIVAIAVFISTSNPAIQLACALATAGCLWFLLGSLTVSHLVYDRSDLYRWQWIERALRGLAPERFLFCHAGLDEASAQLRQHLGAKSWLTLDHYDPAKMTEPSIHRARRLFPRTADTKAAPFDHWSVETASTDVVFGLLAIHELRTESERAAWFAEARRCLSAAGASYWRRHTRDPANFLAFGPGFLHFHSSASWRRCWMRAGLSLHDEFRVTPWVRVFVLSAA